MWKGEVVGIFIAPEKTMSLVSQNEVLAVAGKGLEGDRYFKQVGTYSDRQSLTQEGVLEALTHQEGVLEALTHRGGLNAEILAGGVIRVGDAIEGG